MGKYTREVFVCDECDQETPEDKLLVIPAGGSVGGKKYPEGVMLCGRCVRKLTGEREPTYEPTYSADRDSSSRPGGATGRPFAVGGRGNVVAPLSRRDWSTLPPR